MDNLKRILLVDDDAGILDLLNAALKGDCQVDCASTAKQALECIEQGAYDVVLTDLQMPGISGLELLQLIRGMRPETRVIVMTGQNTSTSVVSSLREEAFSYLCKPFSIGALRDAVHLAFSSKNGKDDIRILSAKPAWISLSLRCKLELADRILNFLRAMEMDLDHEEQEHVATAFRELLINAIEHGGHSDPEKRVELSFVRTGGAIIYYLHDPGDGFSFDKIPHAAISNGPDDPVRHTEIRDQMGIRPGGFGLLLTRNLVDELIYSEKGNEVMLVKYLRTK